MNSTNFNDWIALPLHAAFGQAEYPLVRPSDLICDIRNRVKAAAGQSNAHTVKVVVADEAERDLLAAEMETKEISQIDGQTFAIHDYSELIRDMETSVWHQSSQNLLVVICQVDMSYSAESAVFMGELMVSAKAPGLTRLRVLTMSGSDDPEESLSAALACFASNIDMLYRISLSALIPGALPRRVHWISTDFSEPTVKNLKILLPKGLAITVHGSPAEARAIEL